MVRMINRISGLFLFLVASSYSSCAQNDHSKINLSISFEEPQIVLEYDRLVVSVKVENRGESAFLLPDEWEHSNLYFNFGDTNIYRISKHMHKTLPEKKKNYDMSDNCNLPKDQYIELKPSEVIVREVNLSKLYFGFQIGKEYNVTGKFHASEDLLLFCPKYFVGSEDFGNKLNMHVVY